MLSQGTHHSPLLLSIQAEQRFLLFKPIIFLISTIIFAELPVLLPREKTLSKLFLNYLTLRNVHFSDDCALIASQSAQVYCLYKISPSECFTFCNVTASLHRLPSSCLYCMRVAGRESTCLWLHVTTSCVFQSFPVPPHCFPLRCSQQYPWEHLCINFLLNYGSHAKDNLA